MVKNRPVFKFWLETDEGYVFGEGPANLLYQIQRFHTLSGAAKALGMSYRYAWGILREIEGRMGKPVVKTYKGGKCGGGGAELTKDGTALLEQYFSIMDALPKISERLAAGDFDFEKGFVNEIRGEVISIDLSKKSATVKVTIDASQIVILSVEKALLEEKSIGVGSRVRVKARGINLADE